jgi:hypothetical protein
MMGLPQLPPTLSTGEALELAEGFIATGEKNPAMNREVLHEIQLHPEKITRVLASLIFCASRAGRGLGAIVGWMQSNSSEPQQILRALPPEERSAQIIMLHPLMVLGMVGRTDGSNALSSLTPLLAPWVPTSAS